VSGLTSPSVAVIVPAISRFSGEVSAVAEVMTGGEFTGSLRASKVMSTQ
jgi:hypothetical protein